MFPLELSRALTTESATSFTGAKLPFAVKIRVVPIVASDCSDREIDIERLHLRVQAATLFPEKMPLYDMVYESRFRRLRQQFRERP
jgi:hypothetical protein